MLDTLDSLYYFEFIEYVPPSPRDDSAYYSGDAVHRLVTLLSDAFRDWLHPQKKHGKLA
jgi:hypothetical protein